MGLLLEMTTPYACACWMMIKCGIAHRRIWRLNQYLLIHLFHCRTVVEVYTFYMYFSQWENVKEDLPLPISVMFISLMATGLFLLTPYWTHRKTMQLFKYTKVGQVERPVANGGPYTHCNGLTKHVKSE